MNLGLVPLRHVYLFLAPFVLFGLVMAVALMKAGPQWQGYLTAVNIIQYVILLAAIGMNLHIREMWMVGLGTFLNFLVVAANGGMMPVSARALRKVGLEYMLEPEQTGHFVRHVIMSAETRLKPIGDIIPVPGGLFVPPEVASIGDVFVSVAVFVLVQRYMCGKKKSLAGADA